MTRILVVLLVWVFLVGGIAPVTAGPIIINHTCTDITKIPDYWLEQAKSLTLHYAHTSHGSQLITGADAWMTYDAKYTVAVREATTEGLPSVTGALRIYDGTLIDTYATPDLYWDSPTGIASTNTIVNSGHYSFSMFAFCGELSGYTSSQLNAYLNQLNTFELQHPSTRFIYITGHADATGTSGTLAARNQEIRDYVRTNNKILYDFADIGSFDPSGNEYFSRYNGAGDGDECAYNNGNWCNAWVAAHPASEYAQVADLSSECAHSEPLNCVQKGAAFWWMMARLSGWDGTVDSGVPAPHVFSVTPDVGMTGITLMITGLSGSGFDDGAVVNLTKTGSANITMTGAIITPQKITGTFDLTGTVAGQYNVVVTNPDGQSGTLANGFLVTAPPPAPVAAFTGTPVTGTTPLDVTFTDSSTGTSITNRRWDFGDGTISVYDVSINPSHIYTRAGTYNVLLTVTNAGGSTSLNRPGYITVTDNLLTNTMIQIGVFRNSSGSWYLDTTGTGIVTTSFQFGKSEDIPVVGDWDGDGTSDAGVFRPSTGTWGLDTTRTGIVKTSFRFGKSEDIPVVGDWDGDGTSDVGVFRPSSGTWGLNFNKDEVTDQSFHFGKSGDIPVVGDWNSDGTSDVGVFRPSSGTWGLDTTGTGIVSMAFQFGKSGDIPVVGDWDGDGTSDAGVFRPSTGSWYLDTTRTGIVDKAIQFGKSGDFPQEGVWN